ncbi:MAG: TetR/AcrR family transcriptional regulator [Chloroflexi bacterium]|nr:TetR/AcrR family transcriptional regulator [Chloroflexota bacterium]
MKTRDRILDTALNLFNQAGTEAISTNHIAEALGISPGNLYYHFRNKEDIIRAICEQLFEVWDTAYDLPPDRTPDLLDLQNMVQRTFTIMDEYRFVYRELVALLRRDPVLQQRYLVVRERGFAGFQELFMMFVDAGVLKQPESPDRVNSLAEIIWLISEFWLPSVEASGQAVDPAQMRHGVDLMMQVLRPYIKGENSHE